MGVHMASEGQTRAERHPLATYLCLHRHRRLQQPCQRCELAAAVAARLDRQCKQASQGLGGEGHGRQGIHELQALGIQARLAQRQYGQVL